MQDPIQFFCVFFIERYASSHLSDPAFLPPFSFVPVFLTAVSVFPNRDTFFSEIFYIDLFFLPQYHHRDVLCIGQIQLIQKRFISSYDLLCACIQGKTDLIVQFYRINMNQLC